jgi:hypothetical protein
MIITATHVAKHLSDVTDEMIGRAHKAFEIVDGKATGYYLVENSQGECDEDGEVIEYRVTYDAKGFHCTCKSGKEAFANVTNKSGVCVHCRISIAAEAELKAALEVLEAPVVAPTPKSPTKSEKIFYRQEEKRQQSQVSFLAGLPSRK